MLRFDINKRIDISKLDYFLEHIKNRKESGKFVREYLDICFHIKIILLYKYLATSINI